MHIRSRQIVHVFSADCKRALGKRSLMSAENSRALATPSAFFVIHLVVALLLLQLAAAAAAAVLVLVWCWY